MHKQLFLTEVLAAHPSYTCGLLTVLTTAMHKSLRQVRNVAVSKRMHLLINILQVSMNL